MPGRGTRTAVTLACTECKARNYKTTRKEPVAEAGSPSAVPVLELKKFCKSCKKHTTHRETK